MQKHKYPIFIPTKGRFETRMTARALDAIGVDYTEVIEEADEANYRSAGSKSLLVMPQHNKGLVVTRNWIWDYAASLGVKRFWTMDDNIKAFYRYNRNLKVKCASGEFLRAMEDFVERYSNVPVAGMHYHMFIRRKLDWKLPPFSLNSRVYSNMLIDTFARDPRGKPYRNEGFYNDDTDLCLRMLKDGFCTILFNAFLIEKSVTMTVKGGMTPHYQKDGRWKMAEELRRKHPDVTKTVFKWGRWQHHVDYRPFKRNKLIRKPGIVIPDGVNNFGMVLKKIA